jgi:hypothetical protein
MAEPSKSTPKTSDPVATLRQALSDAQLANCAVRAENSNLRAETARLKAELAMAEGTVRSVVLALQVSSPLPKPVQFHLARLEELTNAS